MHLSRSLLLCAAFAAWPLLAQAAVQDPPLTAAPHASTNVDIAGEARAIDTLVTAGLSSHKIDPTRPQDDAAFLRRIYLMAAGRIPTIDEATAFLSSSGPDKRSALILQLTLSPAWVDQEFNWWADFLRVESQPMKRFPGEPYVDWLKQSIRDDLPYDQMVTKLLTASGPALERGNGATGFYLRDAGMPLDNMSFTVQEFLGTRVACAQCHNHPFDKWTRMQYMEMAAFTGSVSEAPQPEMVKALRQLARSQGALGDDKTKKSLQLVSRTVLLEVHPAVRDSIALPKDYQYPDAKPGQQVFAHTIFGTDIPLAQGVDPRIAYAQWMTSPSNPRFTTVIANRLWKKVMGLGLIEPVDNFTDATVASNPALMDHLTQLMVRIGYDTRLFERILLSTAAFQRETVSADVANPEDFHFPGPLMRRMRAEEVWDSLMTMVIPAVDERKGAQSADGLYATYDQFKDMTPQQILDELGQAVDGQKQRQELQAQLKELVAKYADRKAASQDPEVQKVRQQLQALNQAGGKAMLGYGRRQVPENDPRWRGFPRELVRASELPSPAPPGHLLRDFGQSDRQLIDNTNPSPAVTQALSLLNGVVDQNVLEPGSVLMRAVTAAADPEQQLRLAFLGILTREPTAREHQIFLSGTPVPIADVVWTLVNSREFLFLH